MFLSISVILLLIFLHSLSFLCVHVLAHMYVCVLNPGAGVTDNCEPSDIQAGNQT